MEKTAINKTEGGRLFGSCQRLKSMKVVCVVISAEGLSIEIEIRIKAIVKQS